MMEIRSALRTGRSLLLARVVFVISILGLLLILSFLFQKPAQATSQEEPPNIILVMFDALRADHVSAYGHSNQTTPNLDNRVAGGGVLFSEATSLSSWTKPSNASLFTGKLPSAIFANWEVFEDPIPATETLLAEHLHDAGYVTAGFLASWYIRAQYGFAQGFDIYQPVTEDGQSVTGLATSWLDANGSLLGKGGSPLFLFLYYYDPHSFYDPPPPFDTMFDDDYTGSLTPAIYGHGKDVVSGDLVLSERDLEHLLALYDGDIAFSDQQLGIMLDDLEKRGLLDNSLIVFSSDHGEMFGEHGKWQHNNSLYEEVLRVPLIFRYSGVLPEGKVIDQAVSHVDVMPTVLELAGIDVPEDVAGRSLAPLMKGAAPLTDSPVWAEMAGELAADGSPHWLAPSMNLYAVKENGFKYIHAERLPDADMLYALEMDSIYEQQNIIDSEPDTAGTLWNKLQDQFGIPTEFLFMPFVNRAE